MLKPALVVLLVGLFVGSVAALAPAPFPRDRKDGTNGKLEGNEANERKLLDAIRRRRNDQVNIVLPVGVNWKMPRLAVRKGEIRQSLGLTIEGSGLTITGANDGWEISSWNEGLAKLTLHFRNELEKNSAFSVVVRLQFVKPKSSSNR